MRLGKNTQGAGVWGLTGGPPGVQPPLVPRWMGSPCRRASAGSAPWLPSTLHVLSLPMVIRSVDLLSLLTSLPHSPPPLSASSGRRWMDSVIPLVLFLPSMSSRYLWRRQKITPSLSHMRKPFMREVCSGCFISSWPGRHLRHLSVGQAPVPLRPAVRGQWRGLPSWRMASQDRWSPAGNVLKLVPGKAALKARILKFSFQYKKPKWKKEERKVSRSTM